MVKSELLLGLIQAYNLRDDKKYTDLVGQIIISEENQGHMIFSNKLKKIMKSSIGKTTNELKDSLPMNNVSDPENKFDIQYPDMSFENVALSENQLYELKKIIFSFKNLDKLSKWKIESPSKILFIGPPGTGKTLTAHIIASELKCGMRYIRLDTLISSYLGETGKNIKKIFETPNNDFLIVFLDEFDAIAKKRDDQKETGEIKRVVNTLIQNLDLINNNILIITATNHPELLDNAIWRRFDLILEFEKPDFTLRKKILQIHTKSLPLSSDVDINILSDISNGFSGSDIAQWVKLTAINAIINNNNEILNINFAYGLLETEKNIRIKNRSDSCIETIDDNDILKNKIYKLNQMGLSYKKIGEAYNISLSSAWRRAKSNSK